MQDERVRLDIVLVNLFILFTNTVSHKMVKTAVDEARRKNVDVVRCHTSSSAALENILKEYVA